MLYCLLVFFLFDHIQVIFTNIICFVTWLTFGLLKLSYGVAVQKGGQVTKPIIVVKITCI